MIWSTLDKTYHRILVARFWVKAVVACIMGAGSTLAMPPWNLWPLLWVSFPSLFLLLSSAQTKRAAALLGWWFGLGFFATGFAWISNAFFVDRETFAALALPAIGGLAAGFALYVACVALAVFVFPPLSKQAMPRATVLHTTCRIIFFAALWALVEWWRGWFLTGFPWNPIGSIWVALLPLLQSVSVIGVYGLSFLTVVAATSFSLLVRVQKKRTMFTMIVVCHLPLVAGGLLGGFYLFGSAVDPVPDVKLRLVQPNIAQADKWRPGLRERHLVDQVDMSRNGAEDVTHVLWAETAAPYALNRAPQAVAAVAAGSPPQGVVITGAPRIVGAGKDRQAYNSLYAIDGNGSVVATYDKFHLVPFGEYTPLRSLIPLPQLTGSTGFSAGPGPQMLTVPGLPPFSPLICYEIIFTGAVTPPGSRPGWLFNLTNDAWFGQSSGPFQHLAAAQLRAVEEGLPVVRVANTGISAVIDGHGRILTALDLGQRGHIDSMLPQALPATVFSQLGQGLFLALALAAAGAAWVLARRMTD